MGYCYYNGRLCCDKCGTNDGARKRQCPYKVTCSALQSAVQGYRPTLPYCTAPVLCATCYRAKGGLRGVHSDACRDGAAKAQAEDDAEQARLERGDSRVVSACGGPHSLIPGLERGQVQVIFSTLDGTRTTLVVPSECYPGSGWLSEEWAQEALRLCSA